MPVDYQYLKILYVNSLHLAKYNVLRNTYQMRQLFFFHNLRVVSYLLFVAVELARPPTMAVIHT